MLTKVEQHSLQLTWSPAFTYTEKLQVIDWWTVTGPLVLKELREHLEVNIGKASGWNMTAQSKQVIQLMKLLEAGPEDIMDEFRRDGGFTNYHPLGIYQITVNGRRLPSDGNDIGPASMKIDFEIVILHRPLVVSLDIRRLPDVWLATGAVTPPAPLS